MGQTSSCTTCVKPSNEEISELEGGRNNTVDSDKSPFSGEIFFTKSMKEDKKKTKQVFTNRQAAIILQSFLRGAVIRNSFNTKLKTRLIIENYKLRENLIKKLTPETITQISLELSSFDEEPFRLKNKNNQLINNYSLTNSFLNSSSSSLECRFSKEKLYSISFKNCLVVYYQDKDKVKPMTKENTYKIPTKNSDNSGNNSNTSFKINDTSTNLCSIQQLPNCKSYYIGTVNLKNQRHGQGVFITEDEKKLEGKFNRNKFEGYGRTITSSGYVLEGKFMLKKLGFFIDQLLVGYGHKYCEKDNYSYKGEFVNSKKEGDGIESTQQFTYEGTYIADQQHGMGKIYYKLQGDKYEGEFFKGFIHGKGTYTWKNKEQYVGGFRNGKLHGQGIYKWPNGREFYGTYVDNLKEGKGEFVWKSGKFLKCEYKKGRPINGGIYSQTATGQGVKINVEQIKEILNSEKKLVKEYSFLEYVESGEEDEDYNDDFSEL